MSGSSTSATTSPPHDVRAGALLLVRAVQYLPDDCVVVAVVDPGVGTSRRLVGVEVAGGVLLGPDNGLLAPAVAMAGGARSVGVARQPRVPPARARADLRRARRARPGGRAPRRRGRRWPSSGTRGGSRRPGPRPGLAPRGPRRRLHRRRGVVGRPVRELPAQHRPRRARRGRRAAGVPGRGARRRARSGPPAGCTPTPTPSRRSWCCWSTPTACWRWPSTASRRRRPSVCAPAAASPWCPKAPRSTSPSGASREARDDGHDRHPPRPHPRRRHRPVRPAARALIIRSLTARRDTRLAAVRSLASCSAPPSLRNRVRGELEVMRCPKPSGASGGHSPASERPRGGYPAPQ